MAGWYVITLRCSEGHTWQRRTKNPESADPPCPLLDCASRQSLPRTNRFSFPTPETPEGPPIGMDMTLNKAPATIGANIQVKAIDETARIVMEDQGLTDLRTDVREHETAAPKLSPVQQAMADGFFGGSAVNQIAPSINTARHARAAIAGGMRDPRSTRVALSEVAGKPRGMQSPVHVVGNHQPGR